MYKVLDHIDIQCDIVAVPFKDLSQAQPGEPSENIRQRVIAARQKQTERLSVIAVLIEVIGRKDKIRAVRG